MAWAIHGEDHIRSLMNLASFRYEPVAYRPRNAATAHASRGPRADRIGRGTVPTITTTNAGEGDGATTTITVFDQVFQDGFEQP